MTTEMTGGVESEIEVESEEEEEEEEEARDGEAVGTLWLVCCDVMCS